jgi:Ca2+-binding EF-hand superfamily protein
VAAVTGLLGSLFYIRAQPLAAHGGGAVTMELVGVPDKVIKERINQFRSAHPKGAVWTPRKHMSPRSSIWGLQFSTKVWPKEAIRQDQGKLQPYVAPPLPPHLKKEGEKYMFVKKEMAKSDTYITQEELLEAAEAHMKDAARLESTRATPSLTVLIGQILLTKEQPKDAHLVKICQSWDKKSTGEFIKADLRVNLRSLGLNVTGQQADEIFDSWDADRGGTLDSKELKKALQACQAEAQAFLKAPDLCGAQAEAHRKRADLCRVAAEATAQAIEMEKAHRRHVNGLLLNPSIQLGQLLYNRQIKPSLMVTMWSKTRGPHVGEVSKNDFVRFVGSLDPPDMITQQDVMNVFDTFDADKGGYLDVAEAKSMIKGLLEKSYAEDKVGRKLDLQAQRLRAKACTLSGAAMRPLFGDQRSDVQSSPRSVQSSPRQPSSTPSSRSASKTRHKLRTGGLQVDEEKLTKFVAHFGKVYVSRSFRSWSSWRDSKRAKLVKVNAVARRWFLKAANACFRKWERILEEEKARKMNVVASWQFYNTRIQADALRVWRSQMKYLLRGKQLARLVQTGIRRMGMHPGPRRLLTMVVRRWRQLLDEQKARAQGGLAALCFAVRYCAWPRPAPAVLIAKPTPSSAVAEGEEAAAMAVSVLLAEPTPNSAVPIADGEVAAPAATDPQALHEA